MASFILTALALFPTRTAADYIPHLYPRADNTTTNSTQCRNDTFAFNHVNATSTFTVPGFQPPGFSPRNWTVTTGLRDSRNATGNYSSDGLVMWINSTDPTENLESEDLPYFGCLIEMTPNKRKKSKGDISLPKSEENLGQNGCEGVFSEKCYAAIWRFARNSAENAGGFDVTSARPSRACANLLEFIDDSCDDDEGWSVVGTSPNLFGNGTRDCGDPGVAEGSIMRSKFPLIQEDYRGSYDNFTAYDKYATSASPILLVAFLKNTTENATTTGRWGDARLLCPMPNQFTAGSREAKSSGATRRNPWAVSYIVTSVSCLLFVLL